MTITGRHWLVMSLLAVAAHALVLVYFIMPVLMQGKPDTGMDEVTVTLNLAAMTVTQPVVEETAPPEPPPEPEPPPPPEPKPEPKPKPKPKPEPKPKPQPEPEPKPVQRKSVPSPEVVAAAPAREAPKETVSSQAAAGDPNLQRDYLARVRTHLERHKEYPRRARLRRMEGTVKVEFSFDRQGRVTGSRIVDSSGHRWLDQAALDMLTNANPLPAMPEDIDKHRMTLSIPVVFNIR